MPQSLQRLSAKDPLDWRLHNQFDGRHGNPIEVMDLGLALQALSLERVVKGTDSLPNGPQTVLWGVEQAALKAALNE